MFWCWFLASLCEDMSLGQFAEMQFTDATHAFLHAFLMVHDEGMDTFLDRWHMR